MEKIFINLFFVALALDFGTCFTTNSTHKTEAIMGGYYARNGQFPYQVQLYLNGRFVCGGALVSYKHVVTAGHCLDQYLKGYRRLTVTVGSNTLRGGMSRNVRVGVRHPNFYYYRRRPLNDVAVLTLDRPFPQTPYIRTIPLATRNYRVNEYAVVSGFGKTDKNRPVSYNLKTYSTRIKDPNDCFHYLRQKILAGDICTFTQYGTGICNGDSGGPLVSRGELVGIASWGTGCATGQPDVFANVYTFRNYILSVMY